MNCHPDDPKLIWLAQNTSYCPDTPDNLARFERMIGRLERQKQDRQYRRVPPKKKPALTATQQEAYKTAFRQPQGAYDRGIVARY